MSLLDKDQKQGTIGIIHGWGFDSQVMAGLAAELSPCWNTYLIDMPGYGHKRMTGLSQGIDHIADNLISAIPPHSNLVGWSLGGLVAIKVARALQDKINAIILLSSTPCFVKKHDWPFGVETTLINDMANRISAEENDVLQKFAGLTAKGDICPRDTIRELKLLHKKNRVDPRALRHGLDILINTDLRKELSELRCRVFMLLGNQDHLVTCNTGLAARSIHTQLKLSYIKNAGHAPFISRRKETAEAINNGLQARTL